MLQHLRAFEGGTIAEAAMALGRCTGHISRIVRKHNLDIVARHSDRLPRESNPSGRTRVKLEAVTRELVWERLDYDAKTGLFTWKKKCRNQAKLGDVAGCVRADGYLCISLLGHCFSVHRLAWLYSFGEWPQFFIDHIDGNTLNNAIGNLREATPRQSVQNRAMRGYSRKDGKYEARICVNGQVHRLGSFERETDARRAYLAATEKYFGEFSQVNRSRRQDGGTIEASAASSLTGAQ
jgi:hypothetical protein